MAGLWAYRGVAALAFPVLLAGRLALRRDSLADLGERLALAGGPAPSGALWLHGASVGEITAARPLIEALAARRPLVLTVNTQTARDRARSWALPGVTVTLAPVDGLGAVGRFLRRHGIRGLVTLEHELWPTRFAALAARGLPIWWVAARLSPARGALSALQSGALTHVTRAWPMSETAAEALARAGLPAGRIGGIWTPKLVAPAPAPAPTADKAALAAWQGKPVVLAASTHLGEDAIMLEALRAARRDLPDLRLILAPRHPRRGPALARQAEAAGLSAVRRKDPDPARAETDVLVADTLGEMALWYGAASVTIVGGSFVDHGGHTPVEPVLAGSFVLHGPHIANHRAAFALLHEAGAARQVDPPRLGAAIVAALRDPGRPAAVARGQDAIAAARRDGLGRMDAIVNQILAAS